MTCAEFQDRIVDWLDDSGALAPDVAEHLASCSACAKLHEELRATWSMLKPDVPLEVTPSLKERIMERIDQPSSSITVGRKPWQRLWKVGFAAAAALLVAFWALSGRSHRPAIAFADVVRNMAEFRPYSYTEEFKWATEKKVSVSQHSLMTRDTRRIEYPDGRVCLCAFSLTPYQQMWLWPDQKKAKKQIFEGVTRTPQPSVYEIVQKWTKSGANPKYLRAEWMEEKHCSVFHTVDGDFDCTIWVDNQTGLPVRLEQLRLVDKATFTQSHFQFDIQMDPALFSMEPPADYDTTTAAQKGPKEEPETPFTPYACVDETEKDGNTSSVQQYILSREVRRSEFPDGRVVIFNLSQGVELWLWPLEKRAEKHIGPPHPSARHKSIPELVDALTSVGGWGPKEKGSCIIEGKSCTEYLSSDFGNFEYTVFVDKQTNLPVRTESKFLKEGRTVIESKFSTDIDTDPARFSMEVPPGYTSRVVDHTK